MMDKESMNIILMGMVLVYEKFGFGLHFEFGCSVLFF